MTLPLGLQRGDVYDDSATRISRLTQTDGQHILWDFEVLDGTCKCEGVWGDNTDIRFNIDKAFVVKVFWINNSRMDIGKYLKLVSTSNVVAVTRRAVRDQFLPSRSRICPASNGEIIA